MIQRMISILLLSLFVGTISLSAQEISAGSLRIGYYGSAPVQVEIGGPMYFSESINNSIIFSGLLPGEYTLKVFLPSRHGRSNLLTSERISVFSQQRTIVNIEKNGRISVQFVVDNNEVFLSSGYYGKNPYFPGRDTFVKPPRPINDKEFDQLVISLKKASFDKDKLEILSVSTGYNSFSTGQIRKIMGLFSFDEGKLNCVKVLAPKTFDPQNLYVLADDFSFISTKDKFYEYLRMTFN